jgi:hypothetical protein
MTDIQLDVSDDELGIYIDEILREVDHMLLTVDELATISIDLGLPIALDGGLDLNEAVIDHEAARRSLASKGLVLATEAGTELAPWLTLMADTASDPLLLVRMSRTTPEVSFEWTLFADHLIGVQQQSGADGVVMWAPFPVADVTDLIVDALNIEHVEITEPISFEASLETLSRIDALVGERIEVSGSDFPGIPSSYLSAVVGKDNSTLNIGVLDRTLEPPELHELSWAVLDGQYWEMKPFEVLGDTPPTLTMTLRSGEDILRQILSFFPSVDEENPVTA